MKSFVEDQKNSNAIMENARNLLMFAMVSTIVKMEVMKLSAVPFLFKYISSKFFLKDYNLCRGSWYLCKDNITCIADATFVCDNIPDCPDGDDEHGCDANPYEKD